MPTQLEDYHTPRAVPVSTTSPFSLDCHAIDAEVSADQEHCPLRHSARQMTGVLRTDSVSVLA